MRSSRLDLKCRAHAVLAFVEMSLLHLKKKCNSRLAENARLATLAFNERTWPSRSSRFIRNVAPCFIVWNTIFALYAGNVWLLSEILFDILQNLLQSFQIRGWLGYISKYFELFVTLLEISWSCRDSGLRKCTVKLFWSIREDRPNVQPETFYKLWFVCRCTVWTGWINFFC